MSDTQLSPDTLEQLKATIAASAKEIVPGLVTDAIKASGLLEPQKAPIHDGGEPIDKVPAAPAKNLSWVS